MVDDNFFDAAVRHWYDGTILEREGEYDNAVCMQGFAAECALKTIFEKGVSKELTKKYSHDMKCLLEDILTMSANDVGIVSILDPSCGLRISEIGLEDILFENHPERRYFSNGHYSREDAEKCRENAHKFVKEMLELYVDGYIGIR